MINNFSQVVSNCSENEPDGTCISLLNPSEKCSFYGTNGFNYSTVSISNSTGNPKTLVTTTVDFWPLGLGLILLCTLGLLGNILSAIVLARPKMKSTYSILTLGLTLCDTVYLLTKLMRYGLLSLFEKYSIAYYYTHVVYPISGPHLRALTFTAQTGSTYFTVALAIDRYISVCWPVHARILCTKKQAYILVTAIMSLSILYNIPRWIEFHTNEVKVFSDGDQNETTVMYKMEISPLRKNEVYKTYYIFWAYFLLMNFIPFTTLSFFNFKIFQVVRESNKTRQSLTSYQRREISFAMMLISIVVVFLVCNLDYLILDILSYFKKSYSSFWDSLGNFLLTFNSAVNFVIYCAFGRKFRKEFLQLVREIFCQKDRSNTLYTSKMMSNSNSGGNLSKQGRESFPSQKTPVVRIASRYNYNSSGSTKL